MITHTNNNRALFLAGVDLWLQRPDVREMHYSERGLNVHIVVSAVALEAGEVVMGVCDQASARVTVAQLRARIVEIFDGSRLEENPPIAASIAGVECVEMNTQLMLL